MKANIKANIKLKPVLIQYLIHLVFYRLTMSIRRNTQPHILIPCNNIVIYLQVNTSVAYRNHLKIHILLVIRHKRTLKTSKLKILNSKLPKLKETPPVLTRIICLGETTNQTNKIQGKTITMKRNDFEGYILTYF